MSKSTLNKISYDKIADEWQKIRDCRPIDKCIADFAKLISPGGRILDVGCGTGSPVSEYLVKKGFFVDGIDISEMMIEKALKKNLPRTKFSVCDLFDYFPTVKYDGIIAFDSIWHIDKNEQYLIYEKIASMMKPDSYLIFTHGNKEGEITGKMFGETFYYSALDLKAVLDLMEKASLEPIAITENYSEKTTGQRDLLITAKKIDDLER